jgi:hypothetical protein
MGLSRGPPATARIRHPSLVIGEFSLRILRYHLSWRQRTSVAMRLHRMLEGWVSTYNTLGTAEA